MASEKKTFRYKFSDNIIEIISEFSELHRYDDKEKFNEQWQTFIKLHSDQIQNEERRLLNNGYKGDVKDKMYKSARYYFKNKPVSDNKNTDDKKKRKTYITVGKDILDNMYEHLGENIKETNFKPSNGFDDFKSTIENYDKLTSEDKDKYKKAYKNMYYRFKS
tara:strand:- start:6668 stop:7156 length:489 start_codon:yes stop_codon:yes gene_type:complete